MPQEKKLTHFSLFTGIGGIDLSAEWAGFTTVGQCEIDDYCTRVLGKHWPGVPRWRNIRDVTAESVRAAGIERVDLVSGGVPCQPASCAGKRRGTEDDRWLWPEAIRVVAEIKPRWCLFENPTGILSLQGGIPFESVLSDLEAEGYETGAFIIPACAVGAPHRRDRVWIVAYAKREGLQRHDDIQKTTLLTKSGQDVGHAEGNGHERTRPVGQASDARRRLTDKGKETEFGFTQSCLGGEFDGFLTRLDVYKWPAPCGCEQYEWEPPRVATGMPNRVPRLRALGNAVVPAQCYPILKAIANIERG